MTAQGAEFEITTSRNWRIVRWLAALALLLTPLVAMQFDDGWHWTAGSFVVAGIVIGGMGLLYEWIERVNGSRAYRAGAALALILSFLTVWTTIVRDDGNGIPYFMLVMAAILGSFSAWFRAPGMARTMLGVAIIQALLGLGIATAPVTENIPGGPAKALVFNAIFGAAWLLSAALFRAAAKGARGR